MAAWQLQAYEIHQYLEASWLPSMHDLSKHDICTIATIPGLKEGEGAGSQNLYNIQHSDSLSDCSLEFASLSLNTVSSLISNDNPVISGTLFTKSVLGQRKRTSAIMRD